MLFFTFLAAIAVIVVMEIRIGRIRWLLAEANLRLTTLETAVGDLGREVARLRGATPAAGQEAPSPDTAASREALPPLATDGLPTPQPVPSAAAAAQPAPEAIATGSIVPPVPPASLPPPSAASPAAPKASLEERLGTQWAVWVGGLALGLGGLLLVRYSIEQGYFGPGMRIILGLVFSCLLLCAGEWLRRSEYRLAIAVVPEAHIPSILTAAGSLSLFGTIYAAHALYDFIGPASAFVLLGCVGVLTMLAAALHGPLLAGLGIAASYSAPLLVSTANPRPWPVVIYLAIVSAAALGLARLRTWSWLAVAAIGCGAFWGLLMLDGMAVGAKDWNLAGHSHILIQLALATAVFGLITHAGTRDGDSTPDFFGSAALAALTLVGVLMLGFGRADLAVIILFALIAAALLSGAAWVTPRVAFGAVLAGIIIIATVAAWPGLKTSTDTSHLLREVAGVLLVPQNVASYLMFGAFASLALAALCTVRLMRGQALPHETAALFALAATATPLLTLVLTYLRVTQFETSISFAFAAGVLGLLLAGAAERFLRNEIEALHGTRLATGAYAAAAIAALSLGLVAGLSRGYLTVALALSALGTAFVATRKEIPLLRHVVTVLAAIVLARVAYDPRIMGDGVGRWPVVNWLLIGYGVPAAAFYAAARMLETRNALTSARVADAAAVLLAGLLCFFEIHHALNDGDALAPTFSHIELGLLALVGFGLSWALMRLDLKRGNSVFHWASMGVGVLGGLTVLMGLGLSHNPLLAPSEMVKGWPVFSSLLLAYLVPGLAAVLLARAARPFRPAWYVTGIACLAVLLIFAYVNLEIRHVFQGPDIFLDRFTTAAEWWSYSAAWLVLGLVFLGYGLVRGSIEARIASAILVLLAVIKVFVFDLAGLSGFWRSLSFIVLGLVLIGIGLVYQHLVFGKQARAAPTPPAAGTDVDAP